MKSRRIPVKVLEQIEKDWETYIQLQSFVVREANKLKRIQQNVGGPEHNAYYELDSAITDFVEKVEKRYKRAKKSR